MKSLNFQIYIFLILLLALTGCNELRGRIEVKETLNLRVSKGNNILEPGTYDTTVALESKNGKSKARIEISVKGKKNNPIVNIPLGHGVPDNGDLYLPAGEIGQEFDILGQIATDIFRSQTINSIENCTTTVRSMECKIDINGQRICRPVLISVPGEQHVQYYNETTTVNLDLDLIKDQNRIVASTHNRRSDTTKVYVFKGYCSASYYPDVHPIDDIIIR